MSAEIDVVAAAVVGALTGGSVRPLLAPMDAVAEVWKDRIKARITRTADRASAKKREQEWQSTERIAVRALSEAALTDDPVVQEYLAGVVAGATDTNDNVHLLALISRMTPLHMRLHYLLYWGTACFIRGEDDPLGDWRSMSTRGSNALDAKFVTTPAAVGLTDTLVLSRCLDSLERERLLQGVENYTDAPNAPIFAFQLTHFGVELFSAALGFADLDLGSLLNQHPSVLLFDPPMSDVWVDRFQHYAAEFMIAEYDAGRQADDAEGSPSSPS